MINLKCVKRVLFDDKAAEKIFDKIFATLSVIGAQQEESSQAEWDSMRYEHPLYKICPGLADLVQLELDDSDEEQWDAHQTCVPELKAGVKKFLHSIKNHALQPSSTSPTTSSPLNKRLKKNVSTKRSSGSLDSVSVSSSPHSASKPPIAKRNKGLGLSIQTRNNENDMSSSNRRHARPLRSSAKAICYAEHSDSSTDLNAEEEDSLIA